MTLLPCYLYRSCFFCGYRFFLLTLQRFIGRRGNICQMRSGNGSNFVGAVKELWKIFEYMNHSRITQNLQMQGSDWDTWIKNLPMKSHMGGVWKRQTRSARGITNGLVKTHGKILDDESLHTLLVEVEVIVNSGTIITETISYVKGEIP